jgi:hypothetical protein
MSDGSDFDGLRFSDPFPVLWVKGSPTLRPIHEPYEPKPGAKIVSAGSLNGRASAPDFC